jgi:hypothetical protein
MSTPMPTGGAPDGTAAATTAEPPRVSHVGAWAVDLRIPMGATVTTPGPVLNMWGFAVGVGKRLTHELYLGAFVEFDGGWNLSSDITNSLFSVYRAGADLHYIVHRGTASMSSDGGINYYPVPSQLWIGGRLGPETTDLSSIQGLFGEADFGWDARVGTARAQIGIILSAGLSYEPSGALGSGMTMTDNGAPGTPVATASLNPYFALSFHFVIGG